MLFVVSLCLAAVGCAVSAGWRHDFAFGTVSDSCRDCVSGCGSDSCQDGVPGGALKSYRDCVPEYNKEMLTRFATSHGLFPKAAIHLSVCYPWHSANAAHDRTTHNRPGLFCFSSTELRFLANHLLKKPQGRLIVKNIHLVLCGTLEWKNACRSLNRPKNRNDSRLFLTARLRYALPCFTLAVGKEPPLDYRPDYALFENRLSFLDEKAKLFSEKPSVRRRS